MRKTWGKTLKKVRGGMDDSTKLSLTCHKRHPVIAGREMRKNLGLDISAKSMLGLKAARTCTKCRR